MTADQQFIIQLAQILVPVVTSLIVIVGTVVNYYISQSTNKVAKAAAVASGKAEDAANHHQETMAKMQSTFNSAIAAVAAGPSIVNILPIANTL